MKYILIILCIIVSYLAYQQQQIIDRCDGVIFVNFSQNTDEEPDEEWVRKAPPTTGL
jgi:hypothetical protein